MHSEEDAIHALSIDTTEDRYDRLRLIPWWDQDLLCRAKVVVAGAGALGNEIIKNLALLGVGNIMIIDFDEVETSNLSRSVLYRPQDNGKSKSSAAAIMAKEINSECNVYAMNADIASVGLGVFRWADVVICGLDNREARLAVNKACWKVCKPWVDGATESFQGIVKVFEPPDGVCYECTLSEQDQMLMAVRNSCGFIAKEAYRQGRTPTTPTTAAVIAGIEVQEAIKLLHNNPNLPNLINKGFFFDGSSYDCFTIEYNRRDDCISHETYDCIIESELRSDTATLIDVMNEAKKSLIGEVIIDLPYEMVTQLRCSECESEEELYRLLNTVNEETANCPICSKLRVPEVVSECTEKSAFVAIPLADLGFGYLDILTARSGDMEAHIEISGDFAVVFGDNL